jgi:hypothetical protein
MERDRDLDDALHPAALIAMKLVPDVLKSFVTFEELGGVEERDAFLEFVLTVQSKSLTRRRGVNRGKK